MSGPSDEQSPNERELTDRDYRVDIWDYFERGWTLFTQNAGLLFGFLLVLFAVQFGLGSLGNRLGTILGVIVGGPLNAGWFYFLFARLQGQSPGFQAFFDGFRWRRLPSLINVSVFPSVLTAIGFVLLVLPGVYFSVAYLFAMPLVVERGLKFWPAMETSRRIISRNWFGLFGFTLAIAAVNFIGALLLGVGLLATVPWSVCTLAVAYERIVGLKAT